MYLLDTNVVSELRKARAARADHNVATWAGSVPAGSLFLSVIVIQELEIGTLLAERRNPPTGKILRAWLDDHVMPAFSGRILPVDTAAARRSAFLHVPDPQPIRDGLIAATALVHGMTVVTRNVADFAFTGVPLVNPWNARPAADAWPAPIAPRRRRDRWRRQTARCRRGHAATSRPDTSVRGAPRAPAAVGIRQVGIRQFVRRKPRNGKVALPS